MIRLYRSLVSARALLSVLALLVSGLSVHAQPSGALGDDFIYRVVRDDTLIHLAQRYTHDDSNWRRLQDLNNVAEPTRMPIGRIIRIPFSLIPEETATATIAHIRGEARVNGKRARAGEVIHEGDNLETGDSNSFLTLALPDGGEASLPGATTMQIERLRTFTGTGLIDAIIRLRSGGLETSVAPEDQGTGRYEIRTPVSITGVRGTHFRVRLDTHQHVYNEVLAGTAQLGQEAANGPQVATNQGAVVEASGTIQPVRRLLPAPVLAEALDGSELSFEPLEGAVGYQVRTAADPLGIRPFSVQALAEPPAVLGIPSATTWYVLVRGIDENGLMGPDAVLEVEGGHVLTSTDGLAVLDGSGQPVQLTVY